MLKRNSIASTLIWTLIFTLLVGCSNSSVDGECSTDDASRVAITGLGNTAALEQIISNADFIRYEVVADQRAIVSDEFILSVATQVTLSEPARSSQFSLTDFFSRTAKLTCIPISGVSTQNVATIDVVSESEYSAELPAGTSLADAFLLFGTEVVANNINNI